MGNNPQHPTDAQRQLAALAEQMAAANPDAAEELAKQLAAAVAWRKRPKGFGILIHPNRITGRIELTAGE